MLSSALRRSRKISIVGQSYGGTGKPLQGALERKGAHRLGCLGSVSTRHSSVISTTQISFSRGKILRHWKSTLASEIGDSGNRSDTSWEGSVSQADALECGPLGRPILTEELLSELLSTEEMDLENLEDLVELSGNGGAQFLLRSPKLLWDQAGGRFGFESPQYRHTIQTIPSRNSHQKQYQVTALTVLSSPAISHNVSGGEDLAAATDYYEALKAHDHVGSHPDYDWIELVAVGIATKKKKAAQLAAFDQIRLWKEATGIDLTLPLQSWPAVAFSEGAIANDSNINTQGDDLHLKTLHSRTQSILELLRCSPIKYDFEHHEQATGTGAVESYWTADAETYWRGNYYFSSGHDEAKEEPLFKARSKKAAKKHALVALLEQNRNTPLGEAAESYESLLEKAPQISALMIPRWKEGLAKELESSLTRWEESSEKEINNENNTSSNIIYDETQRKRKQAIGRPRESRSSAAKSADLWNRERAKIERYSARHPKTFQSIQKDRSYLPVTKLRKRLREALQTSDVVLVEAGTGSGKSTQIPQYILEDALSSQKASSTRIIVTQPRRIAAKSLSERVAFERFEPSMGGKGSGRSNRGTSHKKERSVGYSVRYESSRPRKEGGTIEYVTTGILLRRLLGGEQGLDGISHILIDEVHERDLNTDLLLVLIRDLLVRQRQGEHQDLLIPKLVLLSATLDTAALTNYFSSSTTDEHIPIPILSLPTKPLYPVKTLYLEDLIDASNNNNEGVDNFSPKIRELATPLLQHNYRILRKELNDLEDSQEDINTADRIDVLKRAISIRDSHQEASPSSSDDSSEKEDDTPARWKANPSRYALFGLVSELAIHLSKIESNNQNGGSILCFLPGMDEIKECMQRLEEDCPKTLRKRLKIIPLHSEIPNHEQARVFRPAKAGTVKVILSTNIAESSLTIDDVLAVIDCGLVKEATFDVASSMTTVDTNVISKASSAQRLGRVGRVGPGTCYRLYSKGNFEAMEEKAAPEIKTTCLQGTCLQVGSLLEGNHRGFESVKDFLANTMNPPPENSIEVALAELSSMGAIAPSTSRNNPEHVTFLGECLVQLPLDPSIGKMLVMGAVMNCLGPILTAAAWFGGNHNVFAHPFPSQRAEAKEFQRSFSKRSDIEGMIRAYDRFWEVKNQHGWKAAKDWARENCVNPAAMASMGAIRRQLLNELCRIGLVDKSSDVFRRELLTGASVDRHGDSKLLVGALLCTAVPHNLASRNRIRWFGSLTTAYEERARLHPSSVLYLRKPPSDSTSDDGAGGLVVLPEWYSYSHKVQTSDVFLRGCSSMLPEQILIFAGSHLDTTTTDYHHIKGILDGWITIESGSKDGEKNVHLLIRARETIEAITERKLLRLSSSCSQSTGHEERDDLFVDSIRKFFDDLETGRIPDPEPIAPSTDFHDYFLEESEDED